MSARERLAALRSYTLRITTGALIAVAVTALAGCWYYVAHYQPLVMGSSWGDEDTRAVEAPDGTSKAVIQYDAGRTWSYTTSVRNDGRWGVDLAGPAIDP